MLYTLPRCRGTPPTNSPEAMLWHLGALQEGNLKEIKLTGNNDLSVLVDDADYEWLNSWSWHPLYDRGGVLVYARHTWIIRLANGKRSSKGIMMHRHILGLKAGARDPITNNLLEGDFINHNTLDCQRANLRVTDRAGNAQNRRKGTWKQKDITSAYQGVSWNNRLNSWIATIDWTDPLTKKKHHWHLGVYDIEEEAARCRDEYAKLLHGEFASLNFK